MIASIGHQEVCHRQAGFIQSVNFRLANHRHQSTWESKQHPGTGPTLQLDPSLRFLFFFFFKSKEVIRYPSIDR